MNINFKLLMRCIAGLSFASIYGHQFLSVEEVFGLNTMTVSFLTTLLLFYVFAFFYQFHELSKHMSSARVAPLFRKQCHQVQWVLVALNVSIAIYSFIAAAGQHTGFRLAYVGFENFFIIFPEYFVMLIARLFDRN